MRKIARNTEPFNSTPLWRAYRERCYRDLPRPAQIIARKYGLEPEAARLVAELAELTGGPER